VDLGKLLGNIKGGNTEIRGQKRAEETLSTRRLGSNMLWGRRTSRRKRSRASRGMRIKGVNDK